MRYILHGVSEWVRLSRWDRYTKDSAVQSLADGEHVGGGSGLPGSGLKASRRRLQRRGSSLGVCYARLEFRHGEAQVTSYPLHWEKPEQDRLP